MILFKIIFFLFFITNAYAGCSGSPANAACSQWNSDQTNCQSCSSHASQCTWTAANCSGTADCVDYTADETTCNASPGGVCAWSASCTGDIDCGQFGDMTSCNNAPNGSGGACNWIPGDDYGSGATCGPAVTGCSNWAGDEAACAGLPTNCVWVAQCAINNNCAGIGTMTPCNAFTGCSWNASSCSGTMTCSAQTSQTCCTNLSCTWSVGTTFGEVM